MGMLDRIKRRQLDGFKEFVLNMESTGPSKRSQILTAGLLEDPIFMSWVMKNLRSFDDLLKLPSEDLTCLLTTQAQMITLFAKGLAGIAPHEVQELGNSLPSFIAQIRDELQYHSGVPQLEKESARMFMVKTVRKLQIEEKIRGFNWVLPPVELFYPKTYGDGKARITFESGVVAAEGEFFKGLRNGKWKHYYDNGKLLATGEYFNGLKNGTWTFYYSSGQIKAQGNYRQDTKMGPWEEWSRTGEQTTVEYEEGVKKA